MIFLLAKNKQGSDFKAFLTPDVFLKIFTKRLGVLTECKGPQVSSSTNLQHRCLPRSSCDKTPSLSMQFNLMCILQPLG
jgi:hypothetical protein